MNWEIISTLSTILFGGTSALGFILYYRANRRIKNAEATNAKSDAEDNLLKLIDSLTERLSTLNATVDKLIDRNRELSDRLYKSETEINRLNERVIKLTEERNNEHMMKEHYKLWHCRKNDCTDRVPPNKKIKGVKYEPPKRAVT